MRLQRRRWLRLALGGAGAALLGGAASDQARHWRERGLRGFGTTLWLRAGHTDATTADAGLDAAVAALRTVEAQMSLFDPASALSLLNRDGVLDAPHPWLVEVLRLAEDVAVRSDGTFDITVLPLWRAWHAARIEQRIPSDAELRAAHARVDWRAVEVSDSRIRLRRPGMAITLNGIAQGYAADRARDALQAHGIEHALIDAGEWASLGRAPDGAPWRLGVADPRADALRRATLRSDGRAFATSSDAHDTFSADRRDHHIFDPRSGRSPGTLASVTVAAASAALADALTKVLFMADADAALALAAHWGVDALVIDKQGRVSASRGFATV